MKHALKKLSRGSILAYSLILLGIVLVASIGMMSASVTNLKTVSSSDKSINAFQIADSGSQAVIKMLKNAAGTQLKDVVSPCSGGQDATVNQANFLGGEYKVIFQDSDGKTLKCDDSISKVASVKSVGTYRDTARAVQVAVAAGSCPASGGLVLVGKSSDQNGFSRSVVDGFVVSGNAKLVAGECSWGGGSSGMNSFSLTNKRTSTTVYFTDESSAYMSCSGSTCTVNGSAPCDGGWRIFAECPVN